MSDATGGDGGNYVGLAAADVEGVWSLLDQELPSALALRHRLHAAPDLSGDESATRDLLIGALPPGAPSLSVADTGAVVRIGGSGPAIGIRGEMDALPVNEQTTASFISLRPGVMHACGHDVHLAALSAVANAIARLGAAAPAPLLVVLQPREETYPSGAKDVLSSGVLTAENCVAMVGAHVQPSLDPGVVACVPGGVNGSSDEFTIVVSGESGHAAYPHLARDPVLALSAVVVALQSIVSRAVDPMSPAVVGVSSLQAGAAANIVPGLAKARGTIRALSTATRDLLHERVSDVAERVAAAHLCTAAVAFTHGEPVLENDPALAERISRRLSRHGFEVSKSFRSVGSDDFSFYTETIPSAMLFVGTGSNYPLHNSMFLPSDDDVVRVARAMLAGYLGVADSRGALAEVADDGGAAF